MTDQKGEKILLDTTGPIARTNTSYDGTKRRNPNNVVDLKNRKYQCEQVNYDTFISYPQLDAWAAHPDFQSRVSTQIARQVALDRIMIGFNGTSHADESNFSTNKLLQDVNVGWLEHIRTDASERVMNDVTLTSRNMDNTVAHAGKYANADALVQDARSSLLDEWHKEADDLVVIMGRNLFNSLRLPVLNSISVPESQCGITCRTAHPVIARHWRAGCIPCAVLPGCNDADHLVQQPVNLLAERNNASPDERRAGIQPHRHLPVHQ